ncbi:MAG: citrate lyase holo-[acyl-carrier protein] synthase [Synergistaceae bacterium]|nr:citrate lyase holo-[acyl-carrier protein] synthase [Synergistaceae bacterium]
MSDFFSRLLEAREERWKRRLALSRRGPLLTLTLNLPGPDKSLWLAFHAAVRDGLVQDLADWGLEWVHVSSRQGAAGPEDHFLFSPSADPIQIKRGAIDLEEGQPAGRLLDLDVMAAGGKPLGRGDLGLPPRPCLCCPCPARECAALRRHSAEEVLKAAQRLLDSFVSSRCLSGKYRD